MYLYIYTLNVYLWFEDIFTFLYMEEFQKSQGFVFLFFPFFFPGRLSVLKNILTEFSVLMHKKGIRKNFVFIDDYI